MSLVLLTILLTASAKDILNFCYQSRSPVLTQAPSTLAEVNFVSDLTVLSEKQVNVDELPRLWKILFHTEFVRTIDNQISEKFTGIQFITKDLEVELYQKFHGYYLTGNLQQWELEQGEVVEEFKVYSFQERVQSLNFRSNKGKQIKIGEADQNSTVSSYQFDHEQVFIGLQSTSINSTEWINGADSVTLTPVVSLQPLSLDTLCLKQKLCPPKVTEFKIDTDPLKTNTQQVTLTWKAQSNAEQLPDYYEVSCSFPNDRQDCNRDCVETLNSLIPQSEITTPSHTLIFTQSRAGQEIDCSIRAVVDQTCSSDRSELSFSIEAATPAQITNFVIEVKDQESCQPSDEYVLFSWDEPFNGGSQITSYSVMVKQDQKYHTICEVHSSNNSEQPQTKCQVSFSKLKNEPLSLKWADSFEAVVTAQNVIGSSLESALIKSPNLYTKPNAPIKLGRSDQPRSQTAIFLSWLPQTKEEKGGFDEVYYSLFYKETREVGEFKLLKDQIKENSFEVNDVEIGKSYTFIIYSRNKKCVSPASQPIILEHTLVPSAPNCVHTVNEGKDIKVRWESGSANGLLITDWQVRIKTKDQTYELLSQCKKFGGFECVFSDQILRTKPFFLQTLDQIEAQVAGINDLGIGQFSLENTCNFTNAALLDKPAPPSQMVSFVDQSKLELNLEWNEPEATGGLPIDFYTVYTSEKSYEVYSNTFKTEFEVELGSIYIYQVSATNSYGESDKSVEFQVKAALPPETIKEIRLIKKSAFSVAIEWDEPLSNGSEILYYTVSTFSGQQTSQEKLESMDLVVQFEQTNLLPGQIYKFSVTASNHQGSSEESKTIEVKTSQEPDQPIKFSVTREENKFKLEWKEPEFDGGSPITEYYVYAMNLKYHSEFFQIGCESETSNKCLVDFEELLRKNFKLGDEICFALTAVNEVGESNLSTQDCQKLLATPDAPIALRIEEIKNETYLIWEQGYSDGGTPILSYQVYQTNNSDNFNQIGETQDNFYIVDKNGVDIQFKLKATNIAGQSIFSPILNCTKGGEQIHKLREIADQTNGTQISIEWNEHKDATRYFVELLNAQQETIELTKTMDTSIVFDKGIEANKEYQVRLKSIDQSLKEIGVEEIKVFTQACPLKPSQLLLVSKDLHQISLSWEQQENSDTFDLYKNGIIFRSGLTQNVTQLTPVYQGETYQLTIRACNQKCCSDQSDNLSIKVQDKPFPPGRPSTEIDYELQKINFQWAASNDAGSTITKYTLFIRVLEETIQTNCVESDVLQCSLPFQYLMENPFNIEWGQKFEVQVQATNGIGNSLISLSSKSIALGLLPKQPLIQPLNSTKIEENSVTIGIEKFETLPLIERFEVYLKDHSKNQWTSTIIDSNQTQFKLSKLQPDQKYSIKLFAISKRGKSKASEPYTFVFVKPLVAQIPGIVDGLSQNLYYISEPHINWNPVNSYPPTLDYSILVKSQKPELNRRMLNQDAEFELYQEGVLTTDASLNQLKRGQLYLVTVKARNNQGFGQAATPIQIIPSQVPSKPQPVTVIYQYPFYKLYWYEPENGGAPITGYSVHLYNQFKTRLTQNIASDCWYSLQSTQTTCEIPVNTLLQEPYNLNSFDKFTVQVAAINPVGISLFSDFSYPQDVYSRPAPPQNLQNIPLKTTHESITIEWEEGFHSGGLALTGFKAQIYKSSDLTEKPLQQLFLSKDSREVTFGKLFNYLEYYISVTASNPLGDSAESDPIKVIAEDYSTIPSAPHLENDLLITQYNKIGLKWTHPETDGGSKIFEYALMWKKPSDYSYTQYQMEKINSWQTSITIEKLDNFTSVKEGFVFQFQLKAKNTRGYGPKSNMVQVTAIATPSPPNQVQVNLDSTTKSVKVQWAQSFANRAVVTGFRVELDNLPLDCEFEWQTALNCQLKATQLHQKGIANGKEISVRVIAQGDNGESMPSQPVKKLLVFRPGPPLKLQNNLAMTGGKSIGLIWEEPVEDSGAEILDYRILVKITKECSYDSFSQLLNANRRRLGEKVSINDFVETVVGITELSYQIKKFRSGEYVQEGQKYEFVVQARNVIGWGELSNPVNVLAAAPPSPPLNPYIKLDNNRQSRIEVYWQKPQENTKGLQGYKVLYQDKETPCQFISPLDQSCRIELADLSSKPFSFELGQTLDLSVVAKSYVGDSLPSQSLKRAIKFSPLKPVNIKTNVNESKTMVEWSAPVSDQGSPIQEYKVVWKRNGDLEERVTNETSIVIDGVADGQWVKVQAKNSEGWGEMSEPIYLSTYKKPTIPECKQQEEVETSTDFDYEEDTNSKDDIASYEQMILQEETQSFTKAKAETIVKEVSDPYQFTYGLLTGLFTLLLLEILIIGLYYLCKRKPNQKTLESKTLQEEKYSIDHTPAKLLNSREAFEKPNHRQSVPRLSLHLQDQESEHSLQVREVEEVTIDNPALEQRVPQTNAKANEKQSAIDLNDVEVHFDCQEQSLKPLQRLESSEQSEEVLQVEKDQIESDEENKPDRFADFANLSIGARAAEIDLELQN